MGSCLRHRRFDLVPRGYDRNPKTVGGFFRRNAADDQRRHARLSLAQAEGARNLAWVQAAFGAEFGEREKRARPQEHASGRPSDGQHTQKYGRFPFAPDQNGFGGKRLEVRGREKLAIQRLEIRFRLLVPNDEPPIVNTHAVVEQRLRRRIHVNHRSRSIDSQRRLAHAIESVRQGRKRRLADGLTERGCLRQRSRQSPEDLLVSGLEGALSFRSLNRHHPESRAGMKPNSGKPRKARSINKLIVVGALQHHVRRHAVLIGKDSFAIQQQGQPARPEIVRSFYPGVSERVFIILTWIWIFITGVKLYLISINRKPILNRWI